MKKFLCVYAGLLLLIPFGEPILQYEINGYTVDQQLTSISLTILLIVGMVKVCKKIL